MVFLICILFRSRAKTTRYGNPERSFQILNLLRHLGLKIIAGRDFSGQYRTDTAEAVLINRTAAAMLGFTPEEAIGKWIKNTVRDDSRRRIVGVIEDFNFLSLKEKMDALVVSPSEDTRVALIKIKSGNIRSAIATIEKTYGKVAPGYPFEYNFLDQQFDELYKTDLRQQTIIVVFAGLAIFIACLGFIWSHIIYCGKTYQRNWCKKGVGIVDARHCDVTVKRFIEACTAGHDYCNACRILCNEYLAAEFRLSDTDILVDFRPCGCYHYSHCIVNSKL